MCPSIHYPTCLYLLLYNNTKNTLNKLRLKIDQDQNSTDLIWNIHPNLINENFITSAECGFTKVINLDPINEITSVDLFKCYAFYERINLTSSQLYSPNLSDYQEF